MTDSPVSSPKRAIEPDRALGFRFEPPASKWSERDVALFALATGAADDPSDPRQLRRAYEGHSAGMEPLPAFFSVVALNALVAALREGHQAPGLNYGIERVLHAEQTVTFEANLPSRGTLTHRARIAAIHDKGRHAIVVTDVESRLESGELALRSEVSSLVRGAGGFGGLRGEERPNPVPSDRACDVRAEQKTRENQALLFRLLGDDNPLHADPVAARAFGLRRPILHGMCTFAVAARHVVDLLGESTAQLRRITARFSDMVLPGETLVTEIWRLAPDRAAFQVRVTERDRVVLSHGEAWFGPLVAKSEPASAPAEVEELRAIAESIRQHVAKRPALVRSIGAAFQFRLHDPDFEIGIDLREPPGAVVVGAIERPDCTLELAVRDFLALKRGEVLGRSLYLTGALKMTGRTALASHLDFLREVGREDSARTAEAAAAGIAEYAERLDHLVRERASAGERVVLGLAMGDSALTIELGESAGVRVGTAEAPQAVLELDRAALDEWLAGTTNMRALYMRGRLRIAGDIVKARALEALTRREG